MSETFICQTCGHPRNPPGRTVGPQCLCETPVRCKRCAECDEMRNAENKELRRLISVVIDAHVWDNGCGDAPCGWCVAAKKIVGIESESKK